MRDEEMVSHLEDVYYDPDYYLRKEYDEDALFNKADEDYSERGLFDGE